MDNKLQRYSLDANAGKMTADNAGDYMLADEAEDRTMGRDEFDWGSIPELRAAGGLE